MRERGNVRNQELHRHSIRQPIDPRHPILDPKEVDVDVSIHSLGLRICNLLMGELAIDVLRLVSHI